MDQRRPPTLERRSGFDRRRAPGLSGPNGLGDEGWSGIVPFVFAADLERIHPRDPWVSAVRRSVEDYIGGRLDELHRGWDERLEWRVVASWPDAAPTGTTGVIAYHRALHDLTDGTFRQEILSLEASGGPIVEAHVRTTATRGDRHLDLPSLFAFELAALRVNLVTEIPGDPAAWDRFWAD